MPDDDELEELAEVLAQLREGTAGLLCTAADVDDASARAPSLLGGWSRGHLLTHLARNADSHVRRLAGAVEGRVVPQYEGGRAARNAAIEAGATRDAAEILADLVAACEGLDAALAAFPKDRWDAEVEREYASAPASSLPFTRVMEVEVHHADLGLAFTSGDWPLAFVDRALAYTMERMSPRVAETSGSAASWHLHRTDGEGEWLIARSPGGTTITVEHAKGDCAVRGPGHGLLAWLMGRRGIESAGLEVFGDAMLAAELPVLYPYG